MDIGIVGASGRMGQTLIHLINEDNAFTLKGVSDHVDSALIGKDIGQVLLGEKNGVIIADNPLDAFRECEGIIDFSTPQATIETSEIAAQMRSTHVIGTTGMTPEDYEKLRMAAHHSQIIHAGNMSLGINLLTALVEQTAQALGIDYDIEIVEAHHRHKVDAPSGTALMLGESAAKGRGVDLVDVSDRGRDGITGARQPGDIGFSAIRGGDIIGEHHVMFAGTGERITLSHSASDRSLFARGAMQAALWGKEQSPGFYTMRDVLAL